jgi:hypothetical protein
MSKIAPYAKAFIGAVVAALSALLLALDDDTVTTQEWVKVAIALVAGLGAVWAVPWMPRTDTGRDTTWERKPE